MFSALGQVMSSRKQSGGGTTGKGTCASPATPEEPSWNPAIVLSPQRPEATGQSEPLCLSGIVANTSTSASA